MGDGDGDPTKDLQRKYNAMERDRKSYSDESQAVIRKQTCVPANA